MERKREGDGSALPLLGDASVHSHPIGAHRLRPAITHRLRLVFSDEQGDAETFGGRSVRAILVES